MVLLCKRRSIGGLRTKEASEGQWPRSYGESNANEIQSVQKGERSCWPEELLDL